MAIAQSIERNEIRPSAAAAADLSGGELIAATLAGCGITHVFFMESVLRRTLMALETHGVTRVLTHSEAAAVYMADGYARIARRPSLCMCQSVGAANLAAALQDPFLGGTPVIALTGKKRPEAQHRNAYQEIDHAPLFSAVTKFSAAVETPEQLPRLLRQALREATSGAPGPAHLDIAGGYAGEAIETARAAAPVVAEPVFSRFPAFRPAPDPAAIAAVAELVRKAKRPILVAGGGARISGAGPALLALAERCGIPVATSLNAKGLVPENHPLAVGVVGTYSRRPANMAVHAADLVLFVGSHTGDQVTNNWTIPGPNVPVVQIDVDPAELGRSYPNAVPVLADARAAVEALAAALPAGDAEGPWPAHCARLVAEWHRDQAADAASDAVPISPGRLCRELQEALPADAILVSDTGYSGIWTGALVDITQPGQDYIRAAGSLGWGFPASLGAKCAAPQRPVVCFAGDGGFWYHLSELETALRHGINTVTVINNNSGFGQCIDGIARNYGNGPGRPEDLYRFRDTDFAALAEQIGCIGIRVERPDMIGPALRKALAADRPVVVDVVTDLAARAPAPWNPPVP